MTIDFVAELHHDLAADDLRRKLEDLGFEFVPHRSLPLLGSD